MKKNKLFVLVVATVMLLLIAACNVVVTPAPVQEAQVSEEAVEAEQAAEEEPAAAEEAAEEAEASGGEGALPGTSGERFDGQTVVVVSVSGDQG